MKKKTATLCIYQMFGTYSFACEIKYNGRWLDTVMDASSYKCSELAFIKAKALGFTHARLIGVKKPYTLELSIFNQAQTL